MSGTLAVPTSGTVSGLTMAGDINTALAYLATLGAASGTPSAASLGLSSLASVSWHDTTNDILKLRDEADTAFINLLKIDETGKTASAYRKGILPTQAFGQVVVVEATALLTCGAGNMPNTDTTPTSGQGNQILTTSFTPQSASSTILLEAVVNGAASTSGLNAVAALFQGSTCIDAGAIIGQTAPGQIVLRKKIASPGTSAVTFSVNASLTAAGTFYVNGNGAGSRLFGGVNTTSLTITEILP